MLVKKICSMALTLVLVPCFHSMQQDLSLLSPSSQVVSSPLQNQTQKVRHFLKQIQPSSLKNQSSLQMLRVSLEKEDSGFDFKGQGNGTEFFQSVTPLPDGYHVTLHFSTSQEEVKIWLVKYPKEGSTQKIYRKPLGALNAILNSIPVSHIFHAKMEKEAFYLSFVNQTFVLKSHLRTELWIHSLEHLYLQNLDPKFKKKENQYFFAGDVERIDRVENLLKYLVVQQPKQKPEIFYTETLGGSQNFYPLNLTYKPKELYTIVSPAIDSSWLYVLSEKEEPHYYHLCSEKQVPLEETIFGQSNLEKQRVSKIPGYLGKIAVYASWICPDLVVYYSASGFTVAVRRVEVVQEAKQPILTSLATLNAASIKSLRASREGSYLEVIYSPESNPSAGTQMARYYEKGKRVWQYQYEYKNPFLRAIDRWGCFELLRKVQTLLSERMPHDFLFMGDKETIEFVLYKQSQGWSLFNNTGEDIKLPKKLKQEPVILRKEGHWVLKQDTFEIHLVQEKERFVPRLKEFPQPGLFASFWNWFQPTAVNVSL